MGETQAPESPDVADPIVAGTETPEKGDTQAPATPEDVADSIVVAGFPADSSMAVHRREDPDEQCLQIIKGDVTLVVTIRKGKRIGLDTLENVETNVQAIFKRARKEIVTLLWKKVQLLESHQRAQQLEVGTSVV